MVFKYVSDFISYWYFHYTLLSTTYMMEPKEKWTFNTVVIALIAMMIYTTYIFLPGHALMWRDTFQALLASYNVDSTATAASSDGVKT